MTKNSADKISELYPHVNEKETPLPRCWSSTDKYPHINLSQSNMRAQYKGVGKTPKDAASIRATHPIPAACGLFYFEIKVISKGRDGYIGVGLCAQSVNLNKLPGWEKDSYGYHADDGHSFCTSSAGEEYGPTFTTGDVVGCGVNLVDRSCFYTKNGVNLGVVFKDLIPNLYPTIGLQTPGEVVDVNFGQTPFVYDITDMKKELHAQTLNSIQSFPVNAEDGKWHSMLQRMVSSYLFHHGYCATAESFAKSTGQSIAEELSSVRNRQCIQKLLLAGRISEAIDTVQSLYDGLLERNPRLFFQLKCRQFIEMVSGCDGEVRPFTHSPTRSARNSPCGSPARTLNHTNSTGSSGSTSSSGNSTCSTNNNISEPQLIRHDSQTDSTDSIGESSQNGFQNGDSEMIVDAYVGNGKCEEDNIETEEEQGEQDEELMDTTDHRPTSASISVITSNNSKVTDAGPSMRQLCGGNIFAIEKLIAFGKTLQNIYKDISKEHGDDEKNENLMKEAFSLLAYHNPRDSPVGYLLEPVQREEISSILNTAILEAHKLPGQPAVELAIGQARNCLKAMAQNNLGACAFVEVEDFFCDR